MPDRVVREEYGLTELERVAARLVSASQDCKIWLWEGDLGAGKTTMIKAICRFLGVSAPMSSPTFSIVHEYESKKSGTIYHFDFYRLKNEQEALDIGVDEYLDSGNFCFIEWPDRIKSIINQRFFLIRILHQDDSNRVIEYQHS